MTIHAVYGVLIPFLGTVLGAACVLFMKVTLNHTVQRALTGFAAGVMVAASIWSLLIPAMDQSEHMGRFAFLPAVVGFWLGILFLLGLDHVIPHLHQDSDEPEGWMWLCRKPPCWCWRSRSTTSRKAWRWGWCLPVGSAAVAP